MKLFLNIIFLLFVTQFSVAQTGIIQKSSRSAFEGIWQYKNKFQTNTVRIHFEPGKDYAIFTDIGSGVAPSKTFHATVKGNLLVIPARQKQNDYIELEVIKGMLHVRTKPGRWDEKGNIITTDRNQMDQKVFSRIKKI